MKETFQIFLNSRDAMTGSANPNICAFNLSQIIPNISTGRCSVRCSYFDCRVVSSAWTTADVSSILVTASNHIAKNSYQSNSDTTVRNSKIIGIFNTGSTLSIVNQQQANEQFIEIGNIFDGILTIELVDQRRRSLVGDLNTIDKYWSLMIDVIIEETCGCGG